MIDLHSHILPKIDDGAKSIEDSLKMAKIAEKQGFSKIIATPHFIERETAAPKNQVLETIDELNRLLQKEKIHIEILPGNEVYISHNLPEMLKNGEILTLNNGPYVLIEFPMADIPIYTEDVLYEIRLLGYKPVIAHPERYRRIKEDPNYLKALIEQGNYVQINSLSITGGLGETTKKTAEILLKHRMVHFIGTDAHSPRGRAPKITNAIEQINEWVGSEVANTLIHNSIALMNGEDIDIPQPLKYVLNKSFFSRIRNLFTLKKKRVYG